MVHDEERYGGFWNEYRDRFISVKSDKTLPGCGGSRSCVV